MTGSSLSVFTSPIEGSAGSHDDRGIAGVLYESGGELRAAGCGIALAFEVTLRRPPALPLHESQPRSYLATMTEAASAVEAERR